MNVLEEIKRDFEGAKMLSDWLGDDWRHVTREKADHRGLACLRGNGGQKCPYNVEPNWWERVKTRIAEVIRAQLAIKKKLAMTTTFDDQLHMCQQCGCALQLKVHVPIEHIKAHTSPEVLAGFPEWCWQKREITMS